MAIPFPRIKQTTYQVSVANFRFVVIIVKIFGICLMRDLTIQEVYEEGNKDFWFINYLI